MVFNKMKSECKMAAVNRQAVKYTVFYHVIEILWKYKIKHIIPTYNNSLVVLYQITKKYILVLANIQLESGQINCIMSLDYDWLFDVVYFSNF